MGSGDHKHFQQQEAMALKKDNIGAGIPKGCMAVMIGNEGEEQKRFIIPVSYIYHPLFMELLKEAEEEYGFHHTGPISIPCNVQQFSNVEGLIKKEDFFYNHHHHHHHIWCFKA